MRSSATVRGMAALLLLPLVIVLVEPPLAYSGARGWIPVEIQNAIYAPIDRRLENTALSPLASLYWEHVVLPSIHGGLTHRRDSNP